VIVEGEGVVGSTPTILAEDSFQYSSSTICNFFFFFFFLFSYLFFFKGKSHTNMSGYYIFENLKTKAEFKVEIPQFSVWTEKNKD
jgi:uncharacterized protein affecting Mg2+/Co2+ transport